MRLKAGWQASLCPALPEVATSEALDALQLSRQCSRVAQAAGCPSLEARAALRLSLASTTLQMGVLSCAPAQQDLSQLHSRWQHSSRQLDCSSLEVEAHLRSGVACVRSHRHEAALHSPGCQAAQLDGVLRGEPVAGLGAQPAVHHAAAVPAGDCGGNQAQQRAALRVVSRPAHA